MKRIQRNFLLALLCAYCASTLGGTKPNLLFILTDDQGWGTLSCYGNKLVATPHLDRLAAEGARNEYTLRFLKSGARGLYIGGHFVPSLSGRTFETINPANERRLAMVAEAGEADIDAAVAAARKAFDRGPWPRMRPADRAKVLHRLADIVQAHAEELAELDTLDSGLMISVTRPAAQAIPEALREAASWANKVQGETYPTGTDHFSFSLREPVGVCLSLIHI